MPDFPKGAIVQDYVADGKWQKDWSTERDVYKRQVVTATDVGTEYDLHSMADELATEYEDVEKVCINGLYAVSFETESTYGIAFLEDAEEMCIRDRNISGLTFRAPVLLPFPISHIVLYNGTFWKIWHLRQIGDCLLYTSRCV